MSEDIFTCRSVEIDGELIHVHGGAEMTDVERGYFADIVRAAKRRFAAEHAIDDAALDQAEQTGGAHTRHGGEG